MKRLGMTALAILLAAVPAVAVAQEDYEVEMDQSEYADTDAGWRSQRFHVGGSFGNLTGGTGLGSSPSLFAVAAFEVGSDSSWNVRAGYAFAPRFEFELEYGQSSPGLQAVLTDLQGQGRTVVEFADFEYTYFGVSAIYSVVERTRRIAPFLTLGLATVSASSSLESRVDATELGLLFGAGLRIRILDNVAVRGDVRGLRIGFGTKQEDDELPSFLNGSLNASNLIWGVGIDIRL